MAEQKIEDSTLPPARRAVRPFVGPAGGVSAAGPLLRPTGPAGPASRPNPAPFAPPLAPRRAALGTAPSVGAPEPATASVRPPTPARSFDLTVAEPMLARPSEAAMPASATFTANEPTSVSHSYAVDALDAVDAAAVDSDIVESTAALEPELVQSILVEPAPRRPVTSEMVAIDAFEAFDAVWGPTNTPQASPVVSATASPVDAESLGSALDGPNPWTDEMTAAPDASPSLAEHQGVAGADSGSDVVDNGWSRAVTPDSALPAWLLEQPAAMEPPPAFADDPIDVPAASAEPAEPAEPAVGEISSRMLAARAETTTAPVSSKLITSEPAAATTAHVTPILRVSAALERLAERVRGGEIDVSSVAPEAPDPAMLASVLAALLGGSSSR